MSIKVFISKGSTATTEQREFVDAILDMLGTVEITPRILNENEWSHEQPLKAIKKIISECDGAVIIAFTRTQFEKGIELKNNEKKDLENINLPTTWNHIEASLAYSQELPLLVIAENGLKMEGLIEDGYDWRVYWADMNADVVKTDSFKGYLKSWKIAIEENKVKKSLVTELDPSKMNIGTLLKLLPVEKFVKLIGFFLAILILVANTGYKLGSGKWFWQEQNKKVTTSKPTSLTKP